MVRESSFNHTHLWLWDSKHTFLSLCEILNACECVLLARVKANWQPQAALPGVKIQLRYTSVWENITVADWRSTVPSGGKKSVVRNKKERMR